MPESKNRLFVWNGLEEEVSRWLSIHTSPSKCVLDLTALHRLKDVGPFQISCKPQAILDVLQGRTRLLHDGTLFVEIAPCGEYVKVSYFRANPETVYLKAAELDRVLRDIQSGD